VLDHPDRALTRLIFEGVADRMYPEPYSGRTLVRRLAGRHRARRRGGPLRLHFQLLRGDRHPAGWDRTELTGAPGSSWQPGLSLAVFPRLRHILEFTP